MPTFDRLVAKNRIRNRRYDSAAVLRERVRAGVRGGAMTARQGNLLLRRQLSQLPRWLGQERYNGPFPFNANGIVVALPNGPRT